MEWIPRTKKDKADFLIKLIDYDDWQTSDEMFIVLNRIGGLTPLIVSPANIIPNYLVSIPDTGTQVLWHVTHLPMIGLERITGLCPLFA